MPVDYALVQLVEDSALLARIAAGEGMGLLPASFAAIRREGVFFVSVEEGALLQVRLGLLAAPDACIVNKFLQKVMEGLPLSLLKDFA